MSSSSTSPLLFNGPRGFAKARSEKANLMVENRPYIPTLMFDPKDYEASVMNAAKVILSCAERRGELNNDSEVTNIINNTAAMSTTGKVTIICGGLTNALFRVDILANGNQQQQQPITSVLVRIFGAEGMIDRDKETTNFARLCDAKGIVHTQLDYVGRFGNGRVEKWIPNMRPATVGDLQKNEHLAMEVTRQAARLHCSFDIPKYLLEDQIFVVPHLASWNDELVTKISQACARDLRLANIFCYALFGDTLQLFESSITDDDDHDDDDDGNKKAAVTEIMSHIAQQLNRETRWMQNHIYEHHPNAPVAFCHNDINAANILLNIRLDSSTNSDDYDKDSIAIIDYEYGAINYTMYDLANFICEHCGGNDNGIPDYGLLPSLEMQRRLVEQYIKERDRLQNIASASNVEGDNEVSNLFSQVQTFQMVSHFYWGTWGILQGATELLEEKYELENVKSRLHGEKDIDRWCNLRYGQNRLSRYREQKHSILRKRMNQ